MTKHIYPDRSSAPSSAPEAIDLASPIAKHCSDSDNHALSRLENPGAILAFTLAPRL